MMWRFEKSIFSTMWMPRSRRTKTDAIEMQEGRSLVRSFSTPEDAGAGSGRGNCVRAHRARYLGHLPVNEATGAGSTEKTVSLLLDKAAREYTDLDYIYIDVHPSSLVYYTVDYNCKVTEKKSFNISRISYCSGDHEIDPCVFAWIYHQETPLGKGLECHAVRMRNPRRAKVLAVQLQQALHALFKDVQAALESSKMFNAAICKLKHEDSETLVEGPEDQVTHEDTGDVNTRVRMTSLPQPDLVPTSASSPGGLS